MLTSPSVPYLIETTRTDTTKDGKQEVTVTQNEISNVAEWPKSDRHLSYKIMEPVVKVRLVAPQQVRTIFKRQAISTSILYLYYIYTVSILFNC